MTFRMRRAQQDRLARDHVGRFLEQDLAVAYGEAFFSTEGGHVDFGPPARRGRVSLDDAGRIIQSITPLQRVTNFDFAQERVAQIRTPTGGVTRFGYDQVGFPATVERHDGVTEYFAFNPTGDLLSYRLGDGSILRFDYNQQRQLTRVVERTGGERRWQYDDEGRLVGILDPLEHATRFEYTNWDLPSRISHASGTIDDFRYDGDATERRVAGAAHSRVQHDSNGRVTSAEYADGTLAHFSFDEQDRLVEGTLGDVAATFTYDDEGRLAISEVAGHSVKVEYVNGGVARIVLPDGRSASYEYDADGRLSVAIDWQGNRQHFSYEAGERPITRHLPGGLVERHTFDSADRLRFVELGTRDARIWVDSYEHDRMDRVVSRDNNRDGRVNYAYDDGGQLTFVHDGAGVTLEAFSYDASGNRTYAAGQFARYDAGNRAVSNGETEYGFDVHGNRVWARNATGTTHYRYDLRNHLVGVTHPDGSTTEYCYDAFSRRMSKRRENLLVEYVWSGHQLVQELVSDGDDHYTQEYMYWPGEHRPLAMCSHGRIYYYHLDHLGTPQFLTDATGAVVWSARYAAYGATRIDMCSVDQPLRFQGQYFDSETGLHYNRARYYDPALGSYLSLDPGLPPGSANLYRYVAGDPINLTDPLGLFGESWPGWVKTTLSVAASVAVVAVAVIALPAELPILAAVGATLAVGALAGAAGFGVSAAMTKGGCVWCAMKEGALVGAVGALPFVAAIVLAGPAALGVGVMVGLGAASGAMSYTSDCLLYDRPWSTKDFLTTVAISAATAGILKYAGGKIAALRGGASDGTASDGSTAKGGAAGDTALKSGSKYPPIKMTDFGENWDKTHPVKTFTPEELESHRVVAGPDGKLVFAQSGKPVNCDDGIYTMDESGNTYVIEDPQVGRTHHSTMNKSPAGAGQVTSEAGQVKSLDEGTGHFGGNQPSGTVKTVANELKSQGVDMSQADVKPYKK